MLYPYWNSPFFTAWLKIILANNAVPEEMPHFTAPHLGLHCLLTCGFKLTMCQNKTV